MNQGVDMLREQLCVWDANRKTNAFYSILFDYDYKGPGATKHESPTKRLIQQRNAICAHKTRLSMEPKAENGTYILKYNTGLEHSYEIEP